MVKICQTGLLKLNFETRPKKRIFRFLPKISASHGWSWKFFFANFQILGALGCQGWVVIPQNVKKSQNHCTLMHSMNKRCIAAAPKDFGGLSAVWEILHRLCCRISFLYIGQTEPVFVNLLRCPGINSKESIPSAYVARARIFKRLWSPGITSKEWIPPAFVAWLASIITLFLLGS